MEMGGIKVVAHVRGGGELGDEWRLAGSRKPNRTPGEMSFHSVPCAWVWSEPPDTAP